MLTNIIILIGIMVMYFMYALSVKYKEGSIEYITLQDYANMGFWLIFMGLVIHWLS
jgi:hypothetical protein